MIFDPFGWAERYGAATTLHRLIRFGAALLCTGFVLYQVSRFSLYHNSFLWAAETAVYSVVLLAYLLRHDPVQRSRGMLEVLIPVLATLMPFGLLFTPVYPRVLQDPLMQGAVFWAMTCGTGFTVWGLWHLRRHFSITVEARGVVATGPYRFVRHPVYLGEMLAAGAVTIWRFGAINLLIWFCFVALQLLRARTEERILLRTFPVYGNSVLRRWWFWR
jgi:protein-S-isoprenylcysteine O-methyltransferase Ste14